MTNLYLFNYKKYYKLKKLFSKVNIFKISLLLFKAQFEVITSQASYLRSLNILLDHFMKDRQLKEVIPYAERKTIFSNVEKVHSVEQKYVFD